MRIKFSHGWTQMDTDKEIRITFLISYLHPCPSVSIRGF